MTAGDIHEELNRVSAEDEVAVLGYQAYSLHPLYVLKR